MRPRSNVKIHIDESDELADRIIACRRCPRLRRHCLAVAKKEIMRRSKYSNSVYWGKPVPNFGRLPAKLLIVGLAPGAHGANRTSRMFTGDDSGLWLYRALYKAGFSETPNCTVVGDNRLINCSITSVAHCAPPTNRPSPTEIQNCAPFLNQTLAQAKPKVVLALGAIAWTSSLRAIESVYDVSLGKGLLRPKFKHGLCIQIPGSDLKLLGCYHVSRQNTNTGRLTEHMLDQVFTHAQKLVARSKVQ